MSDSMIIFQNNLTYKLPVPSSVTVNRTKKRSYFQNRTYTAQQTMVATLNTGSDFVDTKNSNLVIKLRAINKNSDLFQEGLGVGSAMNLVENVRINHRSGTQFSNIQKLNNWRVLQDRSCETSTWFNTIGKVMGYDNSPDRFTSASAVHTFVIPLCHVAPFFAGHGGVLLPPQMAAALRIELDTSPAGSIFQTTGTFPNVIDDYAIDDCYFDLECVTLMDSASASINTNAQKESLEYLYTDVFTSRSATPSNSTSINVDVNKSVSYCEKVQAFIQPNAAIGNNVSDGFRNPYQPASWWIALGSNYYPSNQRVEDLEVAYMNHLTAYQKMKGKCGDRGQVDMTLDDFSTRYGTYTACLELSDSLALSAQPVTSSRTLRLEAHLDAPLAVDSTVIVYMNYLSSARSTLTSSRVDV